MSPFGRTACIHVAARSWKSDKIVSAWLRVLSGFWVLWVLSGFWVLWVLSGFWVLWVLSGFWVLCVGFRGLGSG